MQMKKLYKYLDNFLIKNTLILIITSLVIKVLSLLNRIIITRLLGNEGISLYVLILPTIMLLCSISSFSLQVTLSKITAENEKSQKFSHKSILYSGLKLGFLATIITSVIFLLSLKIISFRLLKQPDSYYPLLFSLTMIPFSMLNGIYRGIYNGLDNIKTSSRSSLIEQISRMIFSTLLLIIFSDKGLVFSVSISVIAMSIGEIYSLIYNISKFNTYKSNTYEFKTLGNLNHPKDKSLKKELNKEIFHLSFSETITHLMANLTFFLEPIIYTFALSSNGFSQKEIMYHYSEVNAYALPLLTMFMFTSSSIATVIIPTISKNNYSPVSERLVRKALEISFIPGILLSIILFFYGDKYMYFLYKSTSGSYLVRNYSIIFIIMYINPILSGTLQAHGKQKNILLISIITSLCKLILIFVLSYINFINYKSLFYSVIFINILHTLIYYIYCQKLLKLKIPFKDLIKLILLFTIYFLFAYILKYWKINYIIASIIISVTYLLGIKYFFFPKTLNNNLK